jgi:threonylcarbamoyladenosine tRNA methylthiotransferase MtaB
MVAFCFLLFAFSFKLVLNNNLECMKLKIFGCRFNKYYAQKWLNKLWNKENSILIASCAVTDNAKRKFIKEVKQQIKKWNFVYLTGCWAFSKNWKIDENWFYNTYPTLFEFKENIKLLPEKPEINDTEWKTTSSKTKINFSDNLQNKSSAISLYTKWFVIVQLGCDNNCTFCITVKKRWKHKNRTVEKVIEEIKQLEKKWVKEVVLTWINLAAWGLETTNTWPNPIFPRYLKQILKNTSIPRIRISSIWPEFVDNSWYEVLENDRILPYFHLSIQSGSDKILKLMWRHYKSEFVKQIITNFKNMNKSVPINIWADIIVGFPNETEEDFQQTLDLVKNYNISKLHIFLFSEHKIWDFIPASKLSNQVSLKTKKERKKKLIEIGNENYRKLINQTKWKKVKVLIEKNNSGWTENYLKYNSKKKLQNWKIYEFIF